MLRQAKAWRGVLLAVALCGALVAEIAEAQIYSASELGRDRARLVGRIGEMLQTLTRPEYLAPAERHVAGARLMTPDTAPGGDPLGFASFGDTIIMPVAGLKFLEDLTLAYAWRYYRGQSLEPFDLYLAMLRWRRPDDWPGGRPLDPVAAFGLPPRAWEVDARVGRLSLSLRNEAWAFILAHELAHVLYRHPGNRAVAPAVSLANERQADDWAMTLMERTDTIPMGGVLFFQASAAFYTSRADFPSDRAYAEWQRGGATHPVNSDRLRFIAQRLQASARRQVDAARREQLSFIGDKLEVFAAALADPDIQRTIVHLAQTIDPRELPGR